MQITVADLIKSQLRLIGAIAQGETPTSDMYDDAIQANNMMLDSWSARRLLVRSLIQESFALTPGQASYTIGIGKNFNTSKPIAIPQAFLRDTSNLDNPIDVVTEDVFNSFSDKEVTTGTPVALFYDTGQAQQASQYGTIWLYYTPDQNYTLFIEQQKYLTELVNLTDVVTFEPAYYRAIKFNGALEFYHEYRSHTTVPPVTILQSAKESLRIVETMNATQVVANFDIPGCKKGRYNIMSDGYL